MKLLLDTHIWVFSHLAPDRLSSRVRRALASPQTERWLSPISVWELSLLVERGRLRLRTDTDLWVEQALAVAPMRDAALTRAVALESRRVHLSHEDPADRFLAATAAVYDLTLVTSDERLIAGRGYRHLANT